MTLAGCRDLREVLVCYRDQACRTFGRKEGDPFFLFLMLFYCILWIRFSVFCCQCGILQISHFWHLWNLNFCWTDPCQIQSSVQRPWAAVGGACWGAFLLLNADFQSRNFHLPSRKASTDTWAQVLYLHSIYLTENSLFLQLPLLLQCCLPFHGHALAPCISCWEWSAHNQHLY